MKKTTPEMLEFVRKRREEGVSCAEIGAAVGISRNTVAAIIKRNYRPVKYGRPPEIDRPRVEEAVAKRVLEMRYQGTHATCGQIIRECGVHISPRSLRRILQRLGITHSPTQDPLDLTLRKNRRGRKSLRDVMVNLYSRARSSSPVQSEVIVCDNLQDAF